MRVWLFGPCILGGALAVICGGTPPAQAQNYPWCAQYGRGMGGAMNCGFVSFEQCMQTVRGMGGFCIANNTYQPPGAAKPPRRHTHHAAKAP